jgi:hypothetical protein
MFFTVASILIRTLLGDEDRGLELSKKDNLLIGRLIDHLFDIHIIHKLSLQFTFIPWMPVKKIVYNASLPPNSRLSQPNGNYHTCFKSSIAVNIS